MPHQLEGVMAAVISAMVVAEVDAGGNLVLVLAAVVSFARRCRIGDAKPVILQPIDRVICRLVVAIHVARGGRVGIGYLRRGGARHGG